MILRVYYLSVPPGKNHVNIVSMVIALLIEIILGVIRLRGSSLDIRLLLFVASLLKSEVHEI